MTFPVSTGEAARLLGSSEPRLNDLIRRQKITPPPPIVAGRRLWTREHLAQAAESLGLLTAELNAVLAEGESNVG